MALSIRIVILPLWFTHPTMRVAGCNEVIEYRTLLLHRTLVANGTKRHFVAAQQMVALGGKADIAELALSVRAGANPNSDRIQPTSPPFEFIYVYRVTTPAVRQRGAPSCRLRPILAANHSTPKQST